MTLDFSDYFLAVGTRAEGVSAVVDDDELEDYSGNVYLYTTEKGRCIEKDSLQRSFDGRNIVLCSYLGTRVAVSNTTLAAACGTENDLTAASTLLPLHVRFVAR